MLRIILFANGKKNFDCPKSHPKTISINGYNGKTKTSIIIVYKNQCVLSFVIPNNPIKKYEILAEREPLIAKTIKMMKSWKFEVIPQRCLSLFILN